MMRRFLLFFCGVGIVALGLFFIHARLSHVDELNVAVKSDTVSAERQFVIVVASYNNDRYYLRNLDSIFSQEYKNYRVIYTEDCATDGTYENVKRYIEEKNVLDKITLIHNSENRKALHNLYTMIHMCQNDEIVVVMDGDDWFPHPYVLRDLNHYYENSDVWMTYGQYIRYPDDQVGMCAPVTKEFLRKAGTRTGKWQYAHLRTFYAGLFKRIKLEDLFMDGKFFSATYDLAIMFPMMDMAREHVYFTPDVFYVYNYETPLNDAKVRLEEQERNEKILRSKSTYPKLEVHPRGSFAESECDLITFSYNRPMQLYSFLESAEKNIKGVKKIMVVYRADSDYVSAYDIVKQAFPQVEFHKQSETKPKEDFKPLLMQLLFEKSTADFIVFGVDDNIITDTIDLKLGMKMIHETDAYGFFYKLGCGIDYCYTLDVAQGVPELLEVGEDIRAWKFEKGKADWDYPNSVDCVLYRKKDIRKEIEKIAFTSPNYLEGEWSKIAPHQRLGLCHSKARLVNIPINNVSQFRNKHSNAYTVDELNRMFLEGLKIDIAPLSGHQGHAVHEEIELGFVVR